jgi:hypothetical protein
MGSYPLPCLPDLGEGDHMGNYLRHSPIRRLRWRYLFFQGGQ